MFFQQRCIHPHFNPLSPHGERHQSLVQKEHNENFNPLSPHGERQCIAGMLGNIQTISIHSPRMGRDGIAADIAGRGEGFQSTLPAWGETEYVALL